MRIRIYRIKRLVRDTHREVAVLPLLLCIVCIGLFPRPLESAFEEPFSQVLTRIDSAEEREEVEHLEDGGEEEKDGVTESETPSLGEG